MDSKRPHLVALAVAGEGHASPMMHLCSHLSRLNFSISFLMLQTKNSNMSLKKIVERGTWPPPGSNISLYEIKSENINAFPQNAYAEGKIDLIPVSEYRRLHYPRPLKEFLEGIPSVDCFIFDFHLSWAVDVANELGIPGAVFFTGAVAWSWFEMNMPRLMSNGDVPMTESHEVAQDEDYEVLETPSVTLRRSCIPWHFWNDRPWQEYTSNFHSVAFEKARWVLVSSCQELEPEMTEVMKQAVGGRDKYLPVGPLFFLNDRPETVGLSDSDPRCLKWLDEQPAGSVLYIAFGSIAKVSVDELEELGAGLVASKCKFLWVARKSEDEKVLSFYGRIRERAKKQGFFTAWAPQTLVLSHPSVAAFVSHCGWNSTLEGVANGKVILCWPCLFEQNLNRKLIVEEWKVGFGFETSQGKVDRKEVEGKIRLAMEEEQGRSARQRAKEIRRKLKESVAVGSSYKNLQHFIQDMSHYMK